MPLSKPELKEEEFSEIPDSDYPCTFSIRQDMKGMYISIKELNYEVAKK